MPSGSNSPPGGFRALPAAPRYLRRNAARAMSGYLVRGLVELITNARDSGYRLLQKKLIDAQSLTSTPIEVEYIVDSEGKRIVVRDRFEGMTDRVMEEKLLKYGQSASGFEENAFVRGINARGAKDVGVLGEVIFESVSDARYAECVIRMGMYSPPESRACGRAERRRMGVSTGNATIVTLKPFPDTPVPQFNALVQDLNHHIEIRYWPEGLPRIPIVVREVKQRGSGRDVEIVGLALQGSPLLERDVPLPDYENYGRGARIRLYRSPTALALGGNSITRLWRAEAGVLVTDGRSAHDITFFRVTGADDAAAQYVFGELCAPQIVELLKEFEVFEQRREADPALSPPPLNPLQVTDPDRLGLNYEHPFIRSLEERVRPLVQEALATIQRELTPTAQGRVGATLREALDRLGDKLAEKLEIAEGDPGRGAKLPWGLSVIPPRLRVEVEKAKRAGIYFRASPDFQGDVIKCQLSPASDAIRLGSNTVELGRVPDQPGVFRGYVEVYGLRLNDLATVQLTARDQAAVLRVSVRDQTRGVDLDRDLQFSQRRYTSVPGRKKHIEVFADALLSDQTVSVSVEGDSIILSRQSAVLQYDPDRGIAVMSFSAESGTKASAKVRAECGELSDEAIVIFEPIAAKAKLDFDFTDRRDFGAGKRFRWSQEKPNTILIAAKHPTLARVLGPDIDPRTGQQWPGQESPQAVAILAEIIAEAFVAKRLEREIVAGNLAYGQEGFVDPVDYENARYRYFEECHLLCHEALTPPYA